MATQGQAPDSRIPAETPRDNNTRISSIRFVLQLIVIGAVTALCLSLLWYAGHILLLAFGGVILAVFLTKLARLVQRYTPLPYGWSLLLTILFIIAIIGALCWGLSSTIGAQLNELTVQIPHALRRLVSHLREYTWGRRIVAEIDGASRMIASGDMFARAENVLSGTADALVEILMVFLIALYGAITPDLYVNGMLHLVPPAQRERAERALTATGVTLWWWMICRLVSVFWVGIATTVALWVWGLPLALALGIIAGLFRFVPYIGPWIGAVPAVLIAIVQGPWSIVFVVVLYIVVETIDDYIILPLLNYGTIWMPPALGIFAQVLFGALWGMIGVLFAIPVAVALMILIQVVYVEGTLGERFPLVGEKTNANGQPQAGRTQPEVPGQGY